MRSEVYRDLGVTNVMGKLPTERLMAMPGQSVLRCASRTPSRMLDQDGIHRVAAHRNAVVVRRWDNRVPETFGTVYLTNGPVSDPFVVFDTYDWRSVIENGIFKEGKHPWHLGRFPKKTEAAVVVHCHFTVLVMTLSTAFRLWQAQSAAAPPDETEAHPSLSTALLGREGTARWRLRLKEENRDKVIVFFEDAYGIFHLAELAILSGVRLHRLPSDLGSPQAILHRFGLSP